MDPIDIPRSLGIEGLFFVPKKVTEDHRGKLMHMLRKDSSYYDGNFGEIYFSTVKQNVVKGWKLHSKMAQRYAVPTGKILFVFYDDRPDSASRGKTCEVELGDGNYGLLLVPAGIWYSFSGLAGGESLIVNCASIPHDPQESRNEPLDFLKQVFDWNNRDPSFCSG